MVVMLLTLLLFWMLQLLIDQLMRDLLAGNLVWPIQVRTIL